MNVHQNARLTPHSRAELVRRVGVEGQTPTAVAAAFGVTVKTVRKWVARFQTEGVKGLQDRSSRPHHLRRPTPAATVVTIEALRRQRWTGQQIAVAVGVSPATISRILRRLGLNRLQALEPATPVRRYEREHPGELIHIDIKKLGRFDRVGHRITGDRTGQSKRRGVGWEFVHVCIDDASRVAFSQILPDEKKESAVAFLKATVAYYASLGVTITRVMTDNGSCYRSKAFRCACRDLGLKHIRTKPYTPKTNGKAERFIQTALREWAYAQAYSTSDHRAAALPIWLHRYNWHRPHSSLKSKAPISRLALTEDNLLRLHTRSGVVDRPEPADPGRCSAPADVPPSAGQRTPWPPPRRWCVPWPEARWSEGAAPPSRPCRTGTAAPELKHSDDRPHAPWFASATPGASVYPQPQPSGIPAGPFSRSPYHRCGNPVEPSNRRGLMAEGRPILGIDRLHAFALGVEALLVICLLEAPFWWTSNAWNASPHAQRLASGR